MFPVVTCCEVAEFYMQTVGVSHIQTERQERFYFSWRTPVSDPLGGGWQAGGGEGGLQGAFFASFRKVKMHIS